MMIAVVTISGQLARLWRKGITASWVRGEVSGTGKAGPAVPPVVHLDLRSPGYDNAVVLGP
jgi:hypothetical protein